MQWPLLTMIPLFPLVAAIAHAEEPAVGGYVGIQANCAVPKSRRPVEETYNGFDDDCDPKTLDDDLDRDGLRIHEDCDDTVVEDARVTMGSVRWPQDGPLCEANGPLVVRGDLVVDPRVEDLEGLKCVCVISGTLDLTGQTRLDSLAGLDRVRRVGGDLVVSGTASLSDLSGLDALEAVAGDLELSGNDAMVALEGLEALQMVGGDLVLTDNEVLVAVEGIEELQRIGGDLGIVGNDSLTVVQGMNALRELAGSVEIEGNPSLVAVRGLNALAEVGASIEVHGNPKLGELEGLETLATVGAAVAMSGNGGLVEEDLREQMAKAGMEPEASVQAPLVVDGYWSQLGAKGVLATLGIAAVGVVGLILSFPMVVMLGRALLPAKEEAPIKGLGEEDFEHLSFAPEPEIDRSLPRALDGLSPKELMSARMALAPVEVGYGEVLMCKGDNDVASVWLVEGELSVWLEGKEVGSVFPEEVAGEMSMFEEVVRSAEVRAVANSRLVVLERSAYDQLVEIDHPAAHLFEVAALHSQIRKSRDVARRLASHALGRKGSVANSSDSRIDYVLAKMPVLPSPESASSGPRTAMDILRMSKVFNGFEGVYLEHLAKECAVRTIQPGQVLYRQGAESNEMFVVGAGRLDLALVVVGADDAVETDDLHPGDLFGFAGMMAGTPRATSCIARTLCTVLSIDSEVLNRLHEMRHPLGRAFRCAMIRALSAALREANHGLVEARGAGSRQADFLVRARVALSRTR